MDICSLCPRECGADREKNAGACLVKSTIKIAKYYLHPFEEPIISGKNGSGTVFFCGCSLRCKFCQNFEVSRNRRGKEMTGGGLADGFRALENMGAANINLVSPTQYADKTMRALDIYRPAVPVCYNTHGYEKISTLEKLNDYVDIYLPDFKYVSADRAQRYSGISDYFEYARAAIDFMIRSKPCVSGEDGTLKQGVIVRHLILPQNLDETKRVLTALRPMVGDAYLSLMSQYTPFGETCYPELKRRITRREYSAAIAFARSLGYEKVFLQDFDSQSDAFIPKWDY